MAVSVGDELSAWETVSSGVPQGSVLVALLCLIFLNDMPAITTNTTMLFAKINRERTIIRNHSISLLKIAYPTGPTRGK